MDALDRTIPTLVGFLVAYIGNAALRTAPPIHDDATALALDRAVEHAARVLQVLKITSFLCTHLNQEAAATTGGSCTFYTSQRNEGLNDDRLFSTAEPSLRLKIKMKERDWKDIPQDKYWNTFLMVLLDTVFDGTAQSMHAVAVRIQFLAIKPMAACIERHLKTKFCDSVAAGALLQHLKALTGPAENSSMRHLNAADYNTLPLLASDTDVRKITENEAMVYDAVLLHVGYFAGPIDGLVSDARLSFCAVMKSISDTYGPAIAETIQMAARCAGDAGKRELVPSRCNPCRKDYVLDENMFVFAVHVLGNLRAFIEYESIPLK